MWMARFSGYLPVDTPPYVGRVRAMKSPSFTARFLCLIEQAESDRSVIFLYEIEG